ncbi:biotin-dependent carboxyltransferase family protein [Leeia sp. TBRC 13508]|uniref:Biotin-dependent carboxyltransferase family protein n=1 Tax=Leeia speluncae TaxID=2884804 RepID=A0ABS8D521_9NEIS|nr:biotin-dependent carboxyltransferase family protein [Leeia speluncae]MCB6183071.1 biotin-dependent carboxyltransferase family protein [Leeia speluncae]
MAINVLKPGLASSIQDAGRSGYYHLGIPPSGALDQFAFQAANLLVGNDPLAAVLEITLMGPELEFTEDVLVAVTGAVMHPKVNGVPFPLYESFLVRSGEKLTFDYVKRGARAYVAVAGGFAVPEILGSRSTYGLGAFGGYEGRRLQAGDALSHGVATSKAKQGTKLPASMQEELSKQVTLRVMPGLYDHRVKPESLATFFADAWTVAPEADRIGYRLKGGKPLDFVERTPPFGAGSDPSNIVDACYPIGSIQVPSGQEPIILLRDAVSGGGYMMVGAVISADLDLIGQMQPGYQCQFEIVSMEEALAARKTYQEKFQRLYAAFE